MSDALREKLAISLWWDALLPGERDNVAFISGNAMIGHHLGNGATGPDWPSEPSRGDQS